MPRRLLCLGFLAALAAGCAEPPGPPPLAAVPQPETGRRFDPAQAGTIAGVVTWRGPIPRVPPFRSIPEPLSDQPPPLPRDWPNPHAPIVDPVTRGVGSAVVFLRKVDPVRSRPWDLSPPRVELRGQAVHVLQGADDRTTGFAQAGTTVAILSRDESYHNLQGRGAAFFACPLIHPGPTASRPLPRPGVVELRSGTGYFWMRGHLFVDHHPYYVHTDSAGRFRLTGVPAGTCELVAWHPDWRVTESYRNPDSMRVQQVTYRPPFEVTRSVPVAPKQTAQVQLELATP